MLRHSAYAVKRNSIKPLNRNVPDFVQPKAGSDIVDSALYWPPIVHSCYGRIADSATLDFGKNVTEQKIFIFAPLDDEDLRRIS